MNYFKQLLCFNSHDDDVDPANKDNDNTAVNYVKIKANSSEQKPDCIEIFNSSLITSDSSDAASINLADSTENLSLNNDASTDDSAITSTSNKEHSNKHSEKQVKENIDSNDNSKSYDNIKMECSSDKSNALQDDAGVSSRNSMIISDNDDSKAIEVNQMNVNNSSAVSNDSTQEILKTEETRIKEDKAEVDSNNNLDVLAQFIENNILDFVQTPRNISEILSDLKEFDMTPNPNNNSGNSQFVNNDVKICEDNNSVIMDLDSIYDEIEAIDTFIHDISNRQDEEGFNAITTQDVESVFSEHLNDSKPPLSDNNASNSVLTHDIKLQDFEMEIDLLKNSNILMNREESINTKYKFTVQIDVETVSSQNSEVFSQEIECTNSIADNVNDRSISNDITTNKHLGNVLAEPTDKDTFSNVASWHDNYSNNISASKENRTLNIQCKKKQDNFKVIDIIILSSSDDEENCPLAVIKRKIRNKKDISASSHISLSSDESYSKDKDLDYCSGYDSSDFEFITEEEARNSTSTIRKGARPIKKLPKKTLKIQSTERLDSNCSIKYPGSNQAGTSGLINKAIDIAGPSASNNNGDADVYKAGPSGLNNARHDELNNTASNEGHVIPEGDEYLNLFQGMYQCALRPNPYTAENKSCYQRNPTIPGMYIDADGVGFDLAARSNQPYDEAIDDETREEARKNRTRIRQMYPDENRKKRKRRQKK